MSIPTPYYRLFGDTEADLAGASRGEDQTLRGADASTPGWIWGFDTYNLVVGDAQRLLGRAQGGDDTVAGGTSMINSLYGDASRLEGCSRGGNDLLTGGDGAGENDMFGDGWTMAGRSRGGDDTLRGGDEVRGTNEMFGDAVEMSGRARGGDDILIGGSGERPDATNYIRGDAFVMADRARGGNDRLVGADGAAGNVLVGDAHILLDRARCGDDTLVGSRADDTMLGDGGVGGEGVRTGRDLFVIAPCGGRDVIFDFETGRDRIDLTAFARLGIDGRGDLDLAATEDGLRIRFADSSTLLLVGVERLACGDLIFG